MIYGLCVGNTTCGTRDEAGVQLPTPQKTTQQNGIGTPNAPWATPACYWIQQKHTASSAGRKNLTAGIPNPPATQPGKRPPITIVSEKQKKYIKDGRCWIATD